jgi:hypothetical protein
MHSPQHHLAEVRHIIHYFKETSHCDLFFPARVAPKLSTYSDADWAECPNTHRSVTIWCMFLSSSLSYGKVRRNYKPLNPLLNLSITPCRLLARKLFGYAVFWLNLKFLK